MMNIDARIRKLKNELKIPPNKFEWTKHIKNCCDRGDMKNAHESLQAGRQNIHDFDQWMV